jgi:cation transport regulator ChaC
MMRIFAYGSLMNKIDLSRTVPEARNMAPMKMYGYRRMFDLESTYRFDPINNTPICVLNVEKSSSLLDYVNGICFEMDDKSFEDLLEREKAYSLVEATVNDYKEEYKTYNAHFFVSTNYKKYPYQILSELQLEYLKICVEGCRDHGQKFLEDFRKSTNFFDVNDEEMIWSQVNLQATD